MCAHTFILIFISLSFEKQSAMAGKIKIKDIAQRAGVSVGTVDRVIHNRGKVSQKTQEKVEQAMEELQYRPNVIARTLARRAPTRIFALLPYPYQDLYWKKIRQGVLEGFEDYDPFDIKKHILFYDQYDKDHFQSMFQSILTSRTDALILGSDFQKEAIDLLQKCDQKNIPAILINAEINSAPYLGFIGIDTFAAGRLAGRIISSTRNLRRILTLHIVQDIENTNHFKNKEWGMKEILHQSDLPFSCHSMSLNPVTTSQPEMADKIIRKIQEHNIDTLYVTNSRAHLVAPSLKKAFPELYIIGYDLVGTNISLLRRGVINVIIDQRSHLQGYLSIKTLTDHLVLSKKIHKKQYLPLNIIYPENIPDTPDQATKNQTYM